MRVAIGVGKLTASSAMGVKKPVVENADAVDRANSQHTSGKAGKWRVNAIIRNDI